MLFAADVVLSPRSQKARGLLTLASTSNTSVAWLTFPPPVTVLPYQMPHSTQQFPIFARPCPTRPRHGFVESRLVYNFPQLLALYSETRAADPEGELALMPPCTGRASAIATEAGVAWGLTHDGVTGGHGRQWVIPCPAGNWTKSILRIVKTNAAAIGVHTAAYVEAVEDEGKVMVVQLRDGPMVRSATPNYYPTAQYAVTTVECPTPEALADLLGWETAVKALPAGTVVYLQEGGLSSHAAVHAIAAGFCVLTAQGGWTASRARALVGTSIREPAGSVKKLQASHYKRLAKMLRKWGPLSRKVDDEPPAASAETAAALAIATIHSQPLWGPDTHLLQLRAQGVAMTLRLFTAACLGEMRHYKAHVHGSRRVTNLEGVLAASAKYAHVEGAKSLEKAKSDLENGVSRNSIFRAAFELRWHELRKHLVDCQTDFRKNWGGRAVYDRRGNRLEDGGSSSYGGKNWAKCAGIAIALYDAAEAFRARPSAATWSAVLVEYNKAIEASHNGGLLLNKFIDQDLIDRVVKAPQLAYLSPRIMAMLQPTLAKAPTLTPKVEEDKPWVLTAHIARRVANGSLGVYDLYRSWHKENPLKIFDGKSCCTFAELHSSTIEQEILRMFLQNVQHIADNHVFVQFPVDFHKPLMAATSAMIQKFQATARLCAFPFEDSPVLPASIMRDFSLQFLDVDGSQASKPHLPSSVQKTIHKAKGKLAETFSAYFEALAAAISRGHKDTLDLSEFFPKSANPTMEAGDAEEFAL